MCYLVKHEPEHQHSHNHVEDKAKAASEMKFFVQGCQIKTPLIRLHDQL